MGVAFTGGLTAAGVWLASNRHRDNPTLLIWDDLAMGLVPVELGTMRSLGHRFAAKELSGSTAAAIVATLPEITGVLWSAEGVRWSGAPWTVPSALDSAVREQHKAGRTVVVESWVLSRLEATLCAIAALHATSTVPVAPNPVGV